MAETTPNSRTVLVTDNMKVAETVLDWLASEGITAEVFVPAPQTNTEPISGLTEAIPSEELAVRVLNEKQSEDAKKLLSDAQRTARLKEIREKRAERTGTVTAECEECGKSSEWTAEVMGTTETCPLCQAYMDIPDPDDDWSGVDFGQSEDDAEIEKEEEK